MPLPDPKRPRRRLRDLTPEQIRRNAVLARPQLEAADRLDHGLYALQLTEAELAQQGKLPPNAHLVVTRIGPDGELEATIELDHDDI